MKNKKINKTIAILTFAVILTAGFGGLYALLFVGIVNQTKETNESVVQYDELSNKESKLNLSIDLLKDRKTDIVLIENSFIRESKIADFPRVIEDLGTELGVRIAFGGLDQIKSSDGVWALGFQLSASGTFANVMRFLGALENFPSKIEFTTVGLTKTRGGISIDPITKKSIVEPSEWTLSVNAKLLNYLKD